MNNTRPSWQKIALKELCEFKNGLWKGKKEPYINVGVIRNTNFTKEGLLNDEKIAFLDVEVKQYSTRKLEYGDLILEKSGGGPKQPVGRVIPFEKVSGEYSFSNFTSIIRISDKDKLDHKYLHRFLHFCYISGKTEAMQKHSTGIRNLQLKEYKEVKLPLPPLPEQQRIVSILDEAFTAIDQAIANTEKNLANARELFESYLNNVFNQKGESWVNKNLKDILKLEYGKPLPKEDRDVDGKYPAYGANGVKCRTNKCYREGFGIIVGRKGSAGEVTLTEDGYWALDVTYYVDFDQEVYALMFLYYLLLSLKLQSLAKGVKPGINRNDVYAIESAFPPLTEQLCIVSKLDKLITETTKLESFYERKLASLKELKQSVLQKAFSGELTTEDIKHR